MWSRSRSPTDKSFFGPSRIPHAGSGLTRSRARCWTAGATRTSGSRRSARPMLFPRKDEVLDIHRKLLEQFGGSPGLRDEGLLDSALLAAPNSFAQKVATGPVWV